jgi:hypothetical protein
MKINFLHIVMKVALFYTKNPNESSTFLHHFFINPFGPNFSTYIDMQKNSVYTTL